MRLFAFVIVLAMLVLTSGCSQYWYQEGKTFDQCKQDYAACSAEMAKYTTGNGPSLQYEHKFMANCMKDKGYKLVKEGDLPLRVKRQASTADPYSPANGFAGQASQE
jgi:hypothetical protein